ncbi:hypothetical protein [Reichenbachiella ulvae]|uniref:YceI-like domain-containing protein n=1 Tax=Reichenbachiella ulvae TaxID=2980104 RepID=A0ABT3CS63_9BACT|nr:hypothetical protein [Reichenbachiella ulvae]MCV9386541.1 hypothetical protein [Reichenbachiella ulvae]
MIRYKFFLLTFYFILPIFHGYAQGKQHTVQVLSSEISILGTTNVNQFSCTLNESGDNEALRVSSNWDQKRLTFNGLILSYDLKGFDCGLKVMNTDFQEILHADEYPEMKLEIRIIHIPASNNQIAILEVNSDVSVQIAGVSRRFLVNEGRVINIAEDELIFEGQQQMKITDFGITPPEKYFGMVKVNDELTVSFSVRMKVETL